jgi:hypothetical protein
LCRSSLLRGSDAQRLIELAAAVGAGIGGVNQQVNVAAPERRLDLLAAGEQGPGTRFEAKPIEYSLPQRRLDPLTQIGQEEIPSPVLNARDKAALSLPLACAASSAGRSTPIQHRGRAPWRGCRA